MIEQDGRTIIEEFDGAGKPIKRTIIERGNSSKTK
jgi:hypothetical protein